ncbi:hypothetical protein FUAX_01500 [Fulvitalea axinellae]|uniref:Uncharacterized protein n=1 Tax=Fulvitalea axinellae TaxID=1182444 RepID=A0AAU9CVX0_9BACT|nr:hypothetical protein FUAX_01500 [Fulvitalea axinellae]
MTLSVHPIRLFGTQYPKNIIFRNPKRTNNQCAGNTLYQNISLLHKYYNPINTHN